MTTSGQAFEQNVEALLRLIPGFDVSAKQRVGGKEVDLLAVQRSPFSPPMRLAVECKDHKTALSREKVADVWRDYQPLVDSRSVDRVLLVTQKGIVSNAASMIEDLPFTHASYRELFDTAFGAERLLQNALLDIESDQLEAYYQAATCYRIDLDLAIRNVDLYYSEFVDYCVSDLNARAVARFPDRDPTLEDLAEAYRGVGGDVDLRRIPKAKVQAIVKDRIRGSQTQDLLQVVERWLAEEQAAGVGFALLGSYGTGKSAFSRVLTTHLARRYLDDRADRVPLRIELRHFGSHQNIEGLLTHELANRHGMPVASFSAFQSLNAAGRFVIILDGFDEMREGISREVLAYNFAELNRLLVGRAKVVLCGRPTIFASDAEQRRLLVGGTEDYRASARYVQVEIAPLTTPDVRQAIKRYAASRRTELGSGIKERVARLDAELTVNKELQTLLARPVHFPMLVRVLPTWHGPLRDMNRARLYKAFIAQIIERERSRLVRPDHISAEERRQFASDLAVLMYRQGDARSIRSGAIPPQLVAPYAREGDSAEDTKRELVRACFLERKSPDILFFPHKSFAEFLIAEKLREALADNEVTVDKLGIPLTPEIASFLGDIAKPADWSRVMNALPANSEFLLSYARMLGTRDDAYGSRADARFLKGAGTAETISAFRSHGSTRKHRALTLELAEACERCSHQPELRIDVLRYASALMTFAPEYIAVHAWRAASLAATQSSALLPRTLLDSASQEKWLSLKWLAPFNVDLDLRHDKPGLTAELDAMRIAMRMRLVDSLAAVASDQLREDPQ